MKFLRGKDMTVSDFLSRHPGHDLASPYEIIPNSFQSKELLNDTDICCPAKKPHTPVKRVTRRNHSQEKLLQYGHQQAKQGQNVYHNNNTNNQFRDKYNLKNLWCKQKYMFLWNHQNQRF